MDGNIHRFRLALIVHMEDVPPYVLTTHKNLLQILICLTYFLLFIHFDGWQAGWLAKRQASRPTSSAFIVIVNVKRYPTYVSHHELRET